MRKAMICVAVLIGLCVPLKAQWERMNNGLMYMSYPINSPGFAVHQDTIYFIGSSALHKTTNLGESWEFISIPGAGIWGATWCIDLIGDSLLLGTQSRGVLSSYHGFPRSWMHEVTISLGGTTITSYEPFSEARAIALKGFEALVFANGSLYRTTDFGGNWTITGSPPTSPDSRGLSMLYVGDTLYAAIDRSTIGSALAKSGDNGNSWIAIPNNIPGGSTRLAGLGKHGGHWFVGAEIGGGVYTSTNAETFVNWSDGLPSGGDTTVIAYSFAVSGGYVFAGTNWGVFRRPLAQLSTPRGSDRNVSAFALAQNYPNPFNPSTRIAYQIPKTSEVQLKVYDVLGREVETLVSGVQQAGRYEVVFNASRLASGIYFYRLQAGGVSQTMRMVMVK
ncbi:MAG: T9SS type A sorting domain-containing protein [Chloroherpetonaceae bacterium]